MDARGDQFNYPMALGTKSKEEPMKDAQLSKFEVEKGDIVIMGSDGLSDNLVCLLFQHSHRTQTQPI